MKIFSFIQKALDEVVQPAVAEPNAARNRETRIPLSQVGAASFGAAQQPAARQKVRTRVSLPRQPEEVEDEEAAEVGPPKFALTSDADIQRFRDSNKFSPQSDQVG